MLKISKSQLRLISIAVLISILSVTLLAYSMTQSFCDGFSSCFDSGNSSTVSFQVPGRPVTFKVEIAQTPAEHTQGLMYRESLPEDSGMLFIFDRDSSRSFWMKNTLLPLDIIFINSSFHVVSIAERVQPCTANPCQTYPSLAPAMFVVEVNGGLSEQSGITPGTRVDFNIRPDSG